MSIYERDIELTTEERKTLLFLTGNNRIIKRNELSKEEIYNINTFFGKEIHQCEEFLKVIIFKDKVTLKLRNKML